MKTSQIGPFISILLFLCVGILATWEVRRVDKTKFEVWAYPALLGVGFTGTFLGWIAFGSA